MRARLLAAASATTAVLVGAFGAVPATATPAPPPEDQVTSVDSALEGARTAAVETAAEVAVLDVAVAAAEAEVVTAEVALAQAAERFTDAAVELASHEAGAAVARQASADADGALAGARTAMTVVVRETYRGSGDLTAVAGALAPGGVAVLADRLVTLRTLGAQRDRVLQQVDAHRLVADVLAQEAERAVEQAERAAAALEEARVEAEAEHARSEAVARAQQAEQERLLVQLAVLRDTTVDLERQRQVELALQRREREAAEALARSAEEEAAVLAAGPAPGSDPVRPEGAAAARSSRAPQDAAPPPAVPAAGTAPEPSDPAPAAPGPPAAPRENGTPGARPAATPTAAPVLTTTARPSTTTQAPAPRTSSTAPAPRTSSTASAPRPSTTAPAPRTSSTAPAPRPSTTTQTPRPSPTTTTQAPAPAPGGSSRGTAAQGQAAVAWARTQLGKPYRYGGNGPDSYDCSGLTGNAWRNAGVGIPRTSRDQYAATARVPLASLRPGDLIFWASNPRDHRTIYHVAMYSGGGMMVEAPSSGKTVREVPVRWGGTMASGGRP